MVTNIIALIALSAMVKGAPYHGDYIDDLLVGPDQYDSYMDNQFAGPINYDNYMAGLFEKEINNDNSSPEIYRNVEKDSFPFGTFMFLHPKCDFLRFSNSIQNI